MMNITDDQAIWLSIATLFFWSLFLYGMAVLQIKTGAQGPPGPPGPPGPESHPGRDAK